MTATTDLDLLGEFTRRQSQDAFTALVQRHVNFVYCAALRQVRSPELAEEVAQSVFTDLARNAARLEPDTILTAWLYQVTRRTAIDVVRGEVRRRLREKIACEMNAMNATADDWKQIEPLLDEAMHALDDTDRTAVLLRYFENKSLREVGQTLGTTDDTARKRVNRAVERLREFFAKRGVTVGASGLVVVISTNAVQAAPIGLAVTISTAATLAGTAGFHASTAIAATKTIAMTTLQKTLITATLAVVVGGGIYQARQTSRLRKENQTLLRQQAPLAEQIRQLQRERDDFTSKLAALRADNERLNRNTAELLKLRGQVSVVREQLADTRRRTAQPDSPTNELATTWAIGGIKWTPASKDLGLSSPVAAVQTYWWAIASTNAERIQQAMAFDRVTNCVPVSALFAKRESRANQGFYQGAWGARLAALTQDSPYRGRLQIEWMAKNAPNRSPFDPANPPEWTPDRTETIMMMRNDPDEEWKIIGDEHRVILTLDDEDSAAVAKLLIQMPPEQFEREKSKIPERTLHIYEELKTKSAK